MDHQTSLAEDEKSGQVTTNGKTPKIGLAYNQRVAIGPLALRLHLLRVAVLTRPKTRAIRILSFLVNKDSLLALNMYALSDLGFHERCLHVLHHANGTFVSYQCYVGHRHLH